MELCSKLSLDVDWTVAIGAATVIAAIVLIALFLMQSIQGQHLYIWYIPITINFFGSVTVLAT